MLFLIDPLDWHELSVANIQQRAHFGFQRHSYETVPYPRQGIEHDDTLAWQVYGAGQSLQSLCRYVPAVRLCALSM